MTGPRSRRAPICCARTSPTGAISSSGKPISSSPRPKPPFGSSKDQLNSAIRACSGPHPRVLPCLRAVEEPRDMAAARRSRKLAAHRARRTRAHPVARRRVTDRAARPDLSALRNSTRSRSGRSSRSPRHRPTQAHAARRTRGATARTQRLIDGLLIKNVVPIFWLSH